jgi:hypothetical protein
MIGIIQKKAKIAEEKIVEDLCPSHRLVFLKSDPPLLVAVILDLFFARVFAEGEHLLMPFILTHWKRSSRLPLIVWEKAINVKKAETRKIKMPMTEAM